MAGIDAIRKVLARHRHLFDLERDGLGAALCRAFTDGAQGCIAREESPDGSRWDDLSPKYEEWKSFAHPGNPISLLHGVMDNPREVAGEPIASSAGEAAVEYGVSDRARQEAAWFQEGNARQPPRPFWGLTPEGLAGAEKLLDERFATA